MTVPLTAPLSAWTASVMAPAVEPVAIEADLLDPITGEFLSLEDSADPVDAAVQYTFRIERGSGAAVRNVGQRFKEVRYVSPDMPIELESRVREAVAHLEAQSLLRTDQVKVTAADGEAGDDWGEAFYHYRDLTSGEVGKQQVRP